MIPKEQELFKQTALDALIKRQIQTNRRCTREANYASANRAMDWLLGNGATISIPGQADFPFLDAWMTEVPEFVSYWGKPVWKTSPCLSIVGSREPTPFALDWLDIHLTEFLRRTDAATVSGGARGIDQKVHFSSVRAGRPTVVFLPSGLASPYPLEWLGWKDLVIDSGGAIVSTYLPFQEIRRYHFEERNRWIAALGCVLFCVEARRKSGSVMTARLARELGKTTCVLPGRPGDLRCAGSVDQLFENALPIRDSTDLEILFATSRIAFAHRSLPSSAKGEQSGN